MSNTRHKQEVEWDRRMTHAVSFCHHHIKELHQQSFTQCINAIHWQVPADSTHNATIFYANWRQLTILSCVLRKSPQCKHREQTKNQQRINILECLPGRYLHSGQCVLCAVNTYKKTDGNEACTACIPLATTKGTTGQTSNTCGTSVWKCVIALLTQIVWRISYHKFSHLDMFDFR